MNVSTSPILTCDPIEWAATHVPYPAIHFADDRAHDTDSIEIPRVFPDTPWSALWSAVPGERALTNTALQDLLNESDHVPQSIWASWIPAHTQEMQTFAQQFCRQDTILARRLAPYIVPHVVQTYARHPEVPFREQLLSALDLTPLPDTRSTGEADTHLAKAPLGDTFHTLTAHMAARLETTARNESGQELRHAWETLGRQVWVQILWWLLHNPHLWNATQPKQVPATPPGHISSGAFSLRHYLENYIGMYLLHSQTLAVVEAMRLPQWSLERLERLLDLRPQDQAYTLPIDAPLFQTSPITPMATASPMLSSAQALLRHDMWQEDTDGKPAYRRHFSQGRIIEHYITRTDPQSQEPEAVAGKAAWQMVEQFGIPTAYMHLICAAHATSQQRPWQELFRLQGSDLLKTLGMDKRTDLSKAEKLKEIVKQAELVGSLGVWVAWSEGKRDLSVRSSRMWDIAIDVHGDVDLFGKVASPTDVTLTVRPGLWTEKFLNRDGRKSGTALHQFGYLAKETLLINPYQDELAAKLAVYLTIMSRIREIYKVRNLLTAVEPEAMLHHAAQDRRRRYDFKQRWDHALLTLHDKRWKITFDLETYPVQIRPDWALPESIAPQHRRLPRGYLRLLLEAKVGIAPPEPIPQLIAAGLEKPSHSTRKDAPPVLAGAQVRQARESKGWSQRALAAMLGKSPGWVALIEQGKRKIQPADQERLQNIFELDGSPTV